MRNPDPLGDRYPISGPSWREVVARCETLTAQDKARRQPLAAESEGNFWRRVNERQKDFDHQPMDDEAAARAMQAEIDKGGRGR